MSDPWDIEVAVFNENSDAAFIDTNVINTIKKPDHITKLCELMTKFQLRSSQKISLVRSLRHFELDDILTEVNCLRNYAETLFDTLDFDRYPSFDYRVKSVDSSKLKLDRYKNSQSATVKSVFNDLVGIRSFVESYDIVQQLSDNFRLVDMSNGKSNDDGYRGIHIYYAENNFCYPVELQIFTQSDFFFNELLHIYVYKYYNAQVGIKLRSLFDQGLIVDEEDFRRFLNDTISTSQKI